MINKRLKKNNPNRTWKLSNETRKKQSESSKRRPPISEETRLKLRLSHIGRPNNQLGVHRKHSIKTKRKLSLIMKKQWNNGILKGHSQSMETRKKIGLKLRTSVLGKSNHQWEGGITPINYKIRNSIEYKLWRNSVFAKDGYRCVWCKSTKQIQADHIKRFSEYPEFRFAIDNGRTLCYKCHKTTKTYGNKKIRN